ncbi:MULTISPECIES: M23 family metallopeptidase [unclassified Sporosarcina]|uniref:M23 family metallopeptidase n=1 Tax=unclassified Sporosarcina TaxID=2647733 RepID=UPI001A9132F6|nr:MULTISPECIES: M23 family metallopeptidase [unclassified Sporosarcina]MBO0587600.1 M23 family metallopeptidase [Sporosarcina sp. E16_8]MBO0602412.1 M23 family metallopeptidase [Sporosarcina sp. E16_3]
MKKLFSGILGLTLFFSFAAFALAATLYWPTDSTRVTSEFGMRTLNGVTKLHEGLDIGGKTAGVAGDTVRAIHNGVVSNAGWHTTYGNVVYINHVGNNQMKYVNVQSRYAHLTSISVTNGQAVTGNTKVGTMGTTGSSTAVHLHLETRNCSTSACTSSTAYNPRTWYDLDVVPPSLVSEGEIMEHNLDEIDDLKPEKPFFYSLEELALMSPQERIEIGYPEPYAEFK